MYIHAGIPIMYNEQLYKYERNASNFDVFVNINLRSNKKSKGFKSLLNEYPFCIAAIMYLKTFFKNLK